MEQIWEKLGSQELRIVLHSYYGQLLTLNLFSMVFIRKFN